MALNRAALQGIKRKTVEVEIPECNGIFKLREMSGADRNKYEVAIFQSQSDKLPIGELQLKARLVGLCLVDDDGVRLYADDEVHQLAEDSTAAVLDRLFNAAQELNAMRKGAVKEAEKNSAAAPSGDSTSA